MSQYSTLKNFLLAGASLALVAACSDSNISSPGEGQLVPAPGPSVGGPTTPTTPTGNINLLPTGGCPAGTAATTITNGSATADVCEVAVDASGQILADLTLVTSSPTGYYFNAPTFVGSDVGPDGSLGGTQVTVTAEPGAILIFENPTDFFTVNRGSQLVANGTAAEPVIFTSDEDILDDGVANDSQGSARGQWGGLIVNGRAGINNCANPADPATCSTAGEGGTGNYGGNLDTDTSGTLNYVRVQYAGFEITTDNELNGIAFQGVGNGTNLDFLQVHNNDDDGIEFFGGTVDGRHFVVTGVDDDAVDWVAGWSGSVQDVVVIGSGVGDNGFEGDNNENGNDLMPRSNPVISNYTLVGGPTEDLGMQIREGTAGNFINGIVTGWEDGCLDIDDAATFDQVVAGDLDIDATFFSCATAFDDTGNDEDSSMTPVDISTAFPGITVGTSTLSGVLPGSNESAVSGIDPTTIDPNLDGGETFIGAFAPGLSPSQTWAFGWTVPNSVFPAQGCPANTTDITATATVTAPSGGSVCQLSGTITSDTTLTIGNIYRLNGSVFIGQDQGPDVMNPSSGAAVDLAIQAGVQIYGELPTDFLVINRGSTITATGTASSPIVMTSDEEINGTNTGDERGQWGGLIVNGNANINNCANPAAPESCSTAGEGGTGNYGGNDNNDSSGVLNFVRVQNAGFEITTDNELNGIAFQGVGDSTLIDFIQVHNNDDDGIEFFGGTADANHLVITGVDDDGLDWVAGWTGSAQFILIAGSGVGDNGFEGDNNENGNTLTPRSNPIIANWTSVGGPTEDLGMQIREGTAGLFINGLVTDWDDGCLDIDDAATFTNIDSGPIDVASDGVNDDDLQIDATFFGCAVPFDDLTGDPLDITTAFGITVGTTSGTSPEPVPSVVVMPIDPTTVDSSLATVTAIGANGDGSDWFNGWTVPNSF